MFRAIEKLWKTLFCDPKFWVAHVIFVRIMVEEDQQLDNCFAFDAFSNQSIDFSRKGNVIPVCESFENVPTWREAWSHGMFEKDKLRDGIASYFSLSG